MVTYEDTRSVEVFERCHVLDFEAYSCIFQPTENMMGVSVAGGIIISSLFGQP